MPPFGPISRRVLVAALKRLRFSGPYSGGRHEFTRREDVVLAIPNLHRGDIGRDLLARILRQAGVKRTGWERA
jgi:HicA toxin of bacterial toxin-antitoxin,